METNRDFRLYLQNELVRRCQANPKYSLRAFARSLGVEPSFLSKILARKRAITPSTVERFARALSLSPRQVERFNQKTQSKDQSPGATTAENYRQLTLDHFQIIADWYHYAILELLEVKGFKPSNRWIAQALGISVSEAQAAVERLIRAEFIEITPQGGWVNKTGNNTTIGNQFTAGAFRKLQTSVIEMALHALNEIPLEERDQSSMTMAINSKLLPEAKEKIKKFRRALVTYFEQSPEEKDAVYQLGISLYPLTKKRK